MLMHVGIGLGVLVIRCGYYDKDPRTSCATSYITDPTRIKYRYLRKWKVDLYCRPCQVEITDK
jgi:hypothetical protein